MSNLDYKKMCQPDFMNVKRGFDKTLAPDGFGVFGHEPTMQTMLPTELQKSSLIDKPPPALFESDESEFENTSRKVPI